jgi:hypothetical protein
VLKGCKLYVPYRAHAGSKRQTLTQIISGQNPVEVNRNREDDDGPKQHGDYSNDT